MSSGLVENLKDILYKISKELTDDHVNRIKFLLSEILPRTNLTKDQGIRQVFQTLEEFTLIKQSNPWLLIELLLTIRRNDLVDGCFPGLGNETIAANIPTGILSPYRLKLYEVAMDLHEVNIRDLKDRCKIFSKSEMEVTRTSFELFILLEEKRIIHKDDTSKLQSFLRDIGRRDSAEDLQKLGDDVPSQDAAGIQETNREFVGHQPNGTSFCNPSREETRCSGRSKISTSDAHLLAEAGLSVGRIGANGTGFRIGSKYILTAAHVLKLAFGVSESTPTSKESMQERLERQGLKVDFKFASPHLAGNMPIFFPLRHIVFYSGEHEMDFAIVELAPVDKTPLPLPLKFFFDNQGSDNEVTFHLLGHDRSNEQQEIGLQCTTISKGKQLFNLHQGLIKLGVDSSILTPFQNFGKTNHLIQFQGNFKWGGSGSPGVLVRDGEVRVFTMLLRGHFEFEGIPEYLKIQEGLRMWSVKERLRSLNRALCTDIFGDC